MLDEDAKIGVRIPIPDKHIADPYTRFTTPEEEKAIRESTSIVYVRDFLCPICEKKKQYVDQKEFEEQHLQKCKRSFKELLKEEILKELQVPPAKKRRVRKQIQDEE